MQTAAMAKDLMFKLRLDAQDRLRLDALAEHYSAPAATVLRILIKKEFDSVRDVETGPQTRPRAMWEPGVVERRTRPRRAVVAMSETPVARGIHGVSEPPRKGAPKKPRPG